MAYRYQDTVNDLAQVKKLKGWGIDSVITRFATSTWRGKLTPDITDDPGVSVFFAWRRRTAQQVMWILLHCRTYWDRRRKYHTQYQCPVRSYHRKNP